MSKKPEGGFGNGEMGVSNCRTSGDCFLGAIKVVRMSILDYGNLKGAVESEVLFKLGNKGWELISASDYALTALGTIMGTASTLRFKRLVEE